MLYFNKRRCILLCFGFSLRALWLVSKFGGLKFLLLILLIVRQISGRTNCDFSHIFLASYITLVPVFMFQLIELSSLSTLKV